MSFVEYRARDTAHRHFDQLWSDGRMTRSEAYKWLAIEMGMTPEQAHFAKFSPLECHKAQTKVSKVLSLFRWGTK